MAWWKRKNETRQTTEQGADTLEALIKDIDMNKEKAMQIPAVKSCCDFTSNLIAALPINLYENKSGKIIEHNDDPRVRLLNKDTNDLVKPFDLKKNLIDDYLLEGSGHAFINKSYNKFYSINYVESNKVSVIDGINPIFKNAEIMVYDNTYNPWEFINVAQNTKNGISGKGLIANNSLFLKTMYSYLIFENSNVNNVGIKKGAITSDHKLSEEAIAKLKDSWRRLFSQDSKDNAIVLNKGLDYKEMQQTSVEMQLEQIKKGNFQEVCRLLQVPQNIIDGTATEEQYNNWIKSRIIPIINTLVDSINQNLLLESEKDSFYFACDTKELLKGDIEKRYKAYGQAIKDGWIMRNEVRKDENKEEIDGLNVISMNLADVIYDPKTKEYFVPNTSLSKGRDEVINNNLKGGDKDESGDKE